MVKRSVTSLAASSLLGYGLQFAFTYWHDLYGVLFYTLLTLGSIALIAKCAADDELVITSPNAFGGLVLDGKLPSEYKKVALRWFRFFLILNLALAIIVVRVATGYDQISNASVAFAGLFICFMAIFSLAAGAFIYFTSK